MRIVLVGKTGSGKSATGNTILRNTNAFKAAACAKSVTAKTDSKSGDVDGRKITIIDTVGLFDTSMNPESVKKEIARCIEQSLPGPHVFLLVIRLGRFTEEERNTVKWIQENFGEEASKYIIVLFTGEDQLGGKKLDDFLKGSKELLEVIHTCGSRYHSFNNADVNDRKQVTELISMIDTMLETNRGTYYTGEMFEKAQRRLAKQSGLKYIALGSVTGIAMTTAVLDTALAAIIFPPLGLVLGGVVAYSVWNKWGCTDEGAYSVWNKWGCTDEGAKAQVWSGREMKEDKKPSRGLLNVANRLKWYIVVAIIGMTAGALNLANVCTG